MEFGAAERNPWVTSPPHSLPPQRGGRRRTRGDVGCTSVHLPHRWVPLLSACPSRSGPPPPTIGRPLTVAAAPPRRPTLGGNHVPLFSATDYTDYTDYTDGIRSVRPAPSICEICGICGQLSDARCTTALEQCFSLAWSSLPPACCYHPSIMDRDEALKLFSAVEKKASPSGIGAEKPVRGSRVSATPTSGTHTSSARTSPTPT